MNLSYYYSKENIDYQSKMNRSGLSRYRRGRLQFGGRTRFGGRSRFGGRGSRFAGRRSQFGGQRSQFGLNRRIRVPRGMMNHSRPPMSRFKRRPKLGNKRQPSMRYRGIY